ncbi:hypothetical protein RF11_02321 [Thelohanellus kitauei]|uniref:Uncharacterized protein n=1 Tax=Thelohanellus kitauei TaxID=669202 RepID=A0A0C2N7W2_THEKT|nr:hypothetical protein RF11_02321 [Thelohanellus kitauei]
MAAVNKSSEKEIIVHVPATTYRSHIPSQNDCSFRGWRLVHKDQQGSWKITKKALSKILELLDIKSRFGGPTEVLYLEHYLRKIDPGLALQDAIRTIDQAIAASKRISQSRDLYSIKS